VAKSLAGRANELNQAKRRRGDATGGGLLHPHLTPHIFSTPETDCEDDEFLYDALDCMNPWHEPDSSFGFDFHAPDDPELYVDLEL